MTAILDEAVAAVESRARGQRIGRVDLDRRGLVLWLGEGPGARWFRFDGGELRELRPAEDPDVPLARTLAERDRVLAWRPGRRILVRRQSDAGLLRKGYRSARALARAARRHAAVQSAAAGTELVVPALQGEDERESALCLERLEVRPLVVDGSVAARLGAGLRALQEARTDGLDRHDAEDEVDVVRAAWAKVEAVVPDPPREREALLTRLQESAARLPAPAPVLTHRDLHDLQLGDLDGRLALFDFDLVCRADSALDPANLCAHFELRALQGQEPYRSHDPGALVLEGLGRDGEPDFRLRLAFYRATTFARLAAVYRLRPRWAGLCPRLLERARAAVLEVEREA